MTTANRGQDLIYKRLRNADGEDDLACGAGVFFFEATQISLISRLFFNIFDNNIRPERFGGMEELANGVRVEMWDENDNLIIDFLDGAPIVKNADFARLASVDVTYNIERGYDHLPIRWTIAKSGSELFMNPGEKLVVITQDDLNRISEFEVMVQGFTT